MMVSKVARHDRNEYFTTQGCRVKVCTILERDISGAYIPVMQHIELSVPRDEDAEIIDASGRFPVLA